jgi:hypothetical protein
VFSWSASRSGAEHATTRWSTGRVERPDEGRRRRRWTKNAVSISGRHGNMQHRGVSQGRGSRDKRCRRSRCPARGAQPVRAVARRRRGNSRSMGHLPVSRYESVVITSGPAGSTHQLIIIIEGSILFVAQLSKRYEAFGGGMPLFLCLVQPTSRENENQRQLSNCMRCLVHRPNMSELEW